MYIFKGILKNENIMKKILLTLLFITGLTFYSFSQSNTYTHYFGNIHAHSGYSDGNKDENTSDCGDPGCSFELAKKAAHYDFMGISEHNHSQAGMKDKKNWYKGMDMAKKVTTSNFVAMYGMEWGTISNGGHVIIYGYDKLIGWEKGLYDVYNPKTSYDSLFKLIADKKGAIAYLAHPEKTNYNSLFTNGYNETNDQAIIGIAVRTGPALGKNAHRTDYAAKPSGSYYARYKDLLKNGYHLAPGIDHDSHYSNFGLVTQRRLVILAEKLTQDALLEAIRARRFYASDDFNCNVSFSVNDAVMGSIITSEKEPVIALTIEDKDGEEIKYIRLYYGHSGSGINPKYVKLPLQKNSNSYTHTFTNYEKNKEYYYYLEIKQKDGDKIVTAPVWVTNK